MARPKKRSAAQPDPEAAMEGALRSAAGTVRGAKHIELWSLDRLRPYERNARTHSTAQIRQIAESITRFGFNAPILVDGRQGIVAGHGRLAAAQVLELPEVPVIVLDHLSELEARAYLIADNQLSDLSGWNEELLLEELAELEAAGIEPAALGFEGATVDALMRSVSGSTAVREVEPEPVSNEPVSRSGDLWIVGQHRVLCGDSRLLGDIDRVLGGSLADAVITDPPYGIEYVGKTKAALRIQNDGAAELAGLLRSVFTAALRHCRPGSPWYVFSPTGPQVLDFLQVLQALGVFRQTLVWVKDRMVLGRQDYHNRHEAILLGEAPAPPPEPAPGDAASPAAYEPAHQELAYGWAPGGPHRPPADRTWDSVWEFPRPSASRDHPTMKPLELIARAVDHAAAPGRLVLDLFGGSGTTAVACEQLGRLSATIEIDPRYCDVIVQRLVQSSGLSAELEDGTPWAKVLLDRRA
jgi:DNA modification methylase